LRRRGFPDARSQWRTHRVRTRPLKTREGSVAYIERIVAEENDEKDDDEAPVTRDPDDADRWSDGCESFFIETTALMD